MAYQPGYIRWLNALVLLAFGWVAILFEIAPLNEEARAVPAPDLLFCVCAYLVLRRPNSTPAFLVAILALSRDLLGGGPAGLGALTLLAAVETLRVYRETARTRSLAMEFLIVAGLSLAMTTAQLIGLIVTLAPAPALDQLGLRCLGTALAYLLIFALFRWILRIGDVAETQRRTVRE